MRNWVDYPSWQDTTGQDLLAALRTINDTPGIVALWTQVGLDKGDVTWGQPTNRLWLDLVVDAHRSGKLIDLICAARSRSPAIATQLGQVLSAKVSGPPWYEAQDPFGARLVGPGGSSAILDRDQLRQGLRRVVTENFPVLAISGGRPGKSYSAELLRHIVSSPDELVRELDAEEEWSAAGIAATVTAQQYMHVLCIRLGMRLITVDQHTESASVARTLVHELVGRSAEIDPRVRWLFLDGLDRLPPEVHGLVANLAHEIVQGQIPRLRLVVTGHSGGFSRKVGSVLVTETLAKVTRQHVVDFFTDVARDAGQVRAARQIEDLTDEALNEALRQLRRWDVGATPDVDAALGDLKTLGPVVRAIAAREFGQP